MLKLFPLRKSVLTFVSLGVMLVILKWSTDSCLPMNSVNRVFSPTIAAPEAICKQMIRWEVWSHLRQITSISDNSTSLVPENSDNALKVFAFDLLRLPVLLKRVPGEWQVLIAILAATALISSLFAILWQCVHYLCRSREDNPDFAPKPRRLTATKQVLKTYLPSSEGFPLVHYRSLFSELKKKHDEKKETQ